VPDFARVFDRKVQVATMRAAEANRVRRERGVMAALRFGAGIVGSIVRERMRPADAPRTNAFDEQFGTDTARNEKLHGMDIRSANYRHAIYYEPSRAEVLDEAMARLPLRPEECTFVDYGSGKGMVVLRAAAYPFRRAMGVEFARELWETARRNLERHPAALRKAAVEFVLGDAVEFTPPEGNLVLYFYEPFEAPVTQQVLARIDGFRAGREVWVVYAWSKNPSITCKALWDGANFLRTVAEGDGWTIYTGAHV
jgi:hypothetical protein